MKCCWTGKSGKGKGWGGRVGERVAAVRIGHTDCGPHLTCETGTARVDLSIPYLVCGVACRHTHAHRIKMGNVCGRLRRIYFTRHGCL